MHNKTVANLVTAKMLYVSKHTANVHIKLDIQPDKKEDT